MSVSACDCAVCIAIVALSSYWANKVLNHNAAAIMLLLWSKMDIILHTDNIELLKKYSSCFAYYQTPIQLISADYHFYRYFWYKDILYPLVVFPTFVCRVSSFLNARQLSNIFESYLVYSSLF